MYQKNNNKTISEIGMYLISKGVETPLKLQKLLFFIRVEEKRNKKESGYFKENDNFEAWIHGPVNPDSYERFKYYFWGLDEQDDFILNKSEMEKLDKIFLKSFNKYNKYSSQELVDYSHKNKAWIKARQGLSPDEPSQNRLDEEDNNFIQFF